MSWLKNALHQSNTPKESVIGILKQHLGGFQHGRERSQLHASDVTKPNFCPRKWAIDDLNKSSNGGDFIATAMDVTFQMGTTIERLLVERWVGDKAIGNWRCRLCKTQRSFTRHPDGFCPDSRRHDWEYLQLVAEAPEFGLSGAIDLVLDVGAPRYLIVELKTLNPDDFATIKIPQPEHRIRTNLYLNLLTASTHPYKDKFIDTHAHVLYISRAYGKMNADWNEILPFKEFVVKRDSTVLTPLLQRAKALKMFREEANKIPSGICATALDPVAKKCSRCKDCFSGQYPATVNTETLAV